MLPSFISQTVKMSLVSRQGRLSSSPAFHFKKTHTASFHSQNRQFYPNNFLRPAELERPKPLPRKGGRKWPKNYPQIRSWRLGKSLRISQLSFRTKNSSTKHVYRASLNFARYSSFSKGPKVLNRNPLKWIKAVAQWNWSASKVASAQRLRSFRNPIRLNFCLI